MKRRNIPEAEHQTGEVNQSVGRRRLKNLFRARARLWRAVMTGAVIFGAGSLISARADITTGLVSYWSLSDGPGNSNVMDLSGNGNTGTLVNYADTTFNAMWTAPGDPTNGWPYALLFNTTNTLGTNTYINIPASTSLNLPSTSPSKGWTLAAWVNPSVAGSSQPTDAGIVAKGDLNLEQYALYISGGKFTTLFHNSAGTGTESVTASNTITAGTWYHVVAIVQEPYGGYAEAQIYVNGVRESPTNGNTYTTFYTASSNLPVTIGCRANASGTINEAFEGTIDEVRIYDRALSPSDITQLYNNKAFSLQNNGVGSWNGLAGSGGNATLDTTSLNYCTNQYTLPVGTASSLTGVLSLETANSQTIGATFSDVYYSSSAKVAVASTNLTTAAGGVAFATASAPGSATFLNSLLTYTVNSSDANGIIDGPNGNLTSLIIAGGGTLVLTGTNTFSGGITINGATVRAGNGGAVSGQELGAATSLTDDGTLVFDGNNSVTYSGTITGTGAVTQEGSGTLALTGANTYTNGTTIENGGTLTVAAIDDIGTGSAGTGAINLAGGTLNYTGTGDSSNGSTSRQFNGTAGSSNTLNVPGVVQLTLSGRVTSTAAWVVNKTGTGTLNLSGSADNSFLGMNVSAGTVVLEKAGGTGHAIANPLNIASGATVQFGNVGYGLEISNSAAAPVTVNSGGVLDMNGQTETFDVLNLSGTGSGSGALINSATGAACTLTAFVNLASATTVGGAGNITLAGPVNGSGTLTYAGTAAELILAATNGYTGGTVVSSGTLDGNAASSIPGNVTVSGSGILQMDTAYTMYPTATLTLPASPSASIVNLTYSGTQNIGALIIGSTQEPAGTYGVGANNPDNVFTGSGLLNVGQPYWDGNGTDASNGTNTFGGGSGNWNGSADWWTGGNTDTTWAANDVALFGGTAGVVTLSANETANGLIFLTPNYVITNTDGTSQLSLGGLTPMISVTSGTAAISCMIAGGGSGVGLTVDGPGTLALTGSNSYTGGTLITSNATLEVNAISDTGASAIATTGNLTLSGGALIYNGAAATTARTVTVTAGATNTIDVAGGTSLALNGPIAGTGTSAINKTDSGTLDLGGTADNPSLQMNINGGEVIITKSSGSSVHGLGGGTSTVGSGAELQLAGTGNDDLYSGCILMVASGGVLDLNSQSDDMSTLTISGTGIGGTGALINSTTTATSVLTNGASGVVLAGATTVGGPGNITLASAVSGSGATLTYAGTGTLTLSGANSYSGGTIINTNGTVSLNSAANGAGTGAITDNGTLDVGIVGNNASLSNAISGPGTVNVIETSGDNLGFGGSMSAFTGTLNCPASASTAKVQILNTNVAISSLATVNLAAGGTLYLEGTGVNVAAPVNIYGVGNSEAYGALRLENSASVSGPITLYGNTTMGNGQSAAGNKGTISGPIGQSNGTFGIEFTAEPGSIVLTGTNTFTGGISISNTGTGMVIIGGSGTLGSGNYAANVTNKGTFNYNSSSPQTLSGVISGTGVLGQSGPGTLTLTSTNTYSGATVLTNGATLTIAGAGALGYAGTSNSYAGNITNYGTLNYASSAAQILSGAISGTGGVTEAGPGELTLSGVDTYAGPTTIASGATLAVGGTGSISDTTSINIAQGGTLDASAFALSFTMSGSTTLEAAGAGTNVGSSAATIKGGTSGTVNVDGPIALTFTPTSFSGDTTHPSLYVSQGALDLGGSSTTVSNAAATPLGLGTYTLIVVSNGNISASSTNITVTGTGLAAGTGPTLAVSGGTLELVVVASGPPPTPVINHFSFSGGNLIFSGTNGPDNGTYVVLMTTNVALPFTSWTPVSTNTFSGTGTFNVTNAVSGGKGFFAIEVP